MNPRASKRKKTKKVTKVVLGEKTRKEIFESPDAIKNTLQSQQDNIVSISKAIVERKPSRVFLLGSGTSYHAGVVGAYVLNKLTNILAVPVQASEFVEFVGNSISKNDVVVTYSQSGESTDTLVALRHAKSKGALIIGVTNTPGSSLTVESNYSIVTMAGVEESVVATKTFQAQLAVTFLLAVSVAKELGFVSEADQKAIINELANTPNVLASELPAWEKKTKEVALKFKNIHDVFVLGFGEGYALALEAGLKLKEASLTHSETFSVAEFRHGPMSLVTKGVGVLMITPSSQDRLEFAEKLAKELKEKKATIVSISQEGLSFKSKVSDFELKFPKINPILAPIYQVAIVQLLAYNLALARKINPDSPRHLTKVVKLG
ncbi:MAG: SIS domain-containing protein [Thaumarchaeota archaeon]|nr:SIS domain-containing protein [Nitrososphaerota archaeon]